MPEQNSTTKEIPLSRGRVAIVDIDDFGYLSRHIWHCNAQGYAASNIGGKAVLMHRYLLNPPSGTEVDHRDRDTLNNTRANLRFCTSEQQAANQRPRTGKFKGVRARANGTYVVRIRKNQKDVFYRVYQDEKEAARAYDIKAIELYGEFAYLNFPDEKEANTLLRFNNSRRSKPRKIAKTKIYVAGPMAGLAELNFPEFERVTQRLRALGHEVVSPHEICPDKEMAWCDAMKRDIPALLSCAALVRLDGWERSKGATLEHYIATQLGLTVYDVRELIK